MAVLSKQLDADAIVAPVREAIDAWAHRSQKNGNGSESSLLTLPDCDVLTPHEREVLAQIMAAASNKEAARNLSISPRTETHRRHIMQKLSAKNSVDLIRIVLNMRRSKVIV